MKLKLIPLLLCVSMLAACLSGCGGEPAKVEVTESPAPTAGTEETAAPAETEAPQAEEEVQKDRYRVAYEKFDPDRSVLRVGSRVITWAEYYSWIYEIATSIESSLEIADWNEPSELMASHSEDSTFGTYVRETALQYLVLYALIQQKADEMGVALTQEQEDSIKAEIDGFIQSVGGQETFEQRLAEYYMPFDYFCEQHRVIELYNCIFEALYGEDGKNLPEEDAIAYLKDNGYLHAKHILFLTVDDNRQPLPEEEIAQKKEEAEQVLAQLQACPPEDLPELFDSLMQQYSEDTGLLAYPDGYYFRTGEMVAPFENAVLELEENGLSELVESTYGFHIIFCPTMHGDDVMDYDSNYMPVTMRSFVSTQIFNGVMDDWMAAAIEEARNTYERGFNPLDLNELFRIPE